MLVATAPDGTGIAGTACDAAVALERALIAALARHGIACEPARVHSIASALPYVDAMTRRLRLMRGIGQGVGDGLPERRCDGTWKT